MESRADDGFCAGFALIAGSVMVCRLSYRARGLALSLVTLCLIVCGLSARALESGKPLREFGRQGWQSDSGLPQNTVHAIVQTGDGYVWIATEAGLARFDGISFVIFDTGNTPALHSDVILSLQQDEAGTLWIGTANGLVSERAGRFRSYGKKDGLTSPDILSIYLTTRGRLLVLTGSGAAALRAGKFVAIDGTNSLGLNEGTSFAVEENQGRIWIEGSVAVAVLYGEDTTSAQRVEIGEAGELHALAAGVDGKLWIGGEHGLFTLNPDRSITAWSSKALPSNEIVSLLAAPDGSVWIGTSKGLSVWRSGSIRTLPEFVGVSVQKLFRDREGSLWVAGSEGIARIVAGAIDREPRRYLLTGVLSILEDREGNMWFGSDASGLHMLHDQRFFSLTAEDGLSANVVRSVFEDHAGTVWMGTSGGGLDRFVDGRISNAGNRLPSKVVLALGETRDSNGYSLWAGTPEGLARIRGDDSRVFTAADGLSDDFVRSLYADRDGSLWVGTRHGLSHMQGSWIRSYSTMDGLPSDLIGAIVRGRDGTLWVGALGGLSRMQGDRFVSVEGLPSGAITALLEDQQGSLWVGVNEHGLSCIQGSSVTNYSVSKLPATIYAILEDEHGDLWISSRKGIDRVSMAALESDASGGKRLRVEHYGSADGMRIGEASGGGHPAAWRAHDGALWFATLDGVAVMHPMRSAQEAIPPLIAIEEVRVDDKALDPNEHSPIRIAPGHGRLAVQYAGLSFAAPQNVHYRYMLKGFDAHWIEAGARRSAFYTNLPAGSYKFLVCAANGENAWSADAVSQTFIVEPYFYQTIWFYAAGSIILASVAYAVYRRRVTTVAAEYSAVIEERNRIAREIHDTLAQGYVAISLQLELAERLAANSADAAVQQIRQTKEMVREGLEEARRSIWNLRAGAEARTLPALLSAHVAAIARQRPNAVAIRFTVHGSYRPLPSELEREVERVAQEALANAVAHARATAIEVMLSYGEQELELCVQDDGTGMIEAGTGDAGRGHFGLQGMRERAARIGASLKIESTSGAGVTVTLRVALGRAAAEDRL